MNTIVAKGLSKRFGSRQAVQDLQLEVAPGELVAMVGENGAGKSTVLSMLSGQLVPDEGLALIDGHDVYAEPIASRRQLGLVGQDLLLPTHLTIEEMASFVCQIKSIVRDSDRFAHLLEATDLADHVDRPIGELSYGMQRKAAWIVALISQPRAMLVDEGLAGLDIASREALILEVTARLESQVGVLWIEHDVSAIAAIVSRLIVLHGGQAVETLAGEEVRRLADDGTLSANVRRWTRPG